MEARLCNEKRSNGSIVSASSDGPIAYERIPDGSSQKPSASSEGKDEGDGRLDSISVPFHSLKEAASTGRYECCCVVISARRELSKY